MKIWIFFIAVLLPISSPIVSASKQSESTETLSEIYQRVFGKQQTLPTKLEAELHVMSKNIGTLIMHTDGKHITHVPSRKLLPNLKIFLKRNLYQRITKQVADSDWISSKILKNSNITIEYNTMELVAEIKIGSRSLNRRMRSILSAAKGHGRIIPENLEEPAKVSGYSNIFSNFTFNPQSSEHKLSTQLRVESAFNFNGFVLENQLTYRSAADTSLVRDYSRLVIDDVENKHRYRIGDINTHGRHSQSSINLGGVQLVKDTTWTNTSEHRPQGNYRFRLEQSAEVEVYQDGKLTRTVRLKSGEHQLSDLQSGQWTETELRIKDDFGKIKRLRFSHFTDSRLLNPKTSRYAFSVGLLSSFEDNQLKYDTDSMIISAYYQRGITETLTAGVDLQTDGTAFQLGTDAIWATRFGNINAGFTQSRNHAGNNGQAIRFQITNSTSKKYQINPPNWSAAIEGYSRYFQNFSPHESISLPQIELQASGSINKRFSDTLGGSLSGSWSKLFNGGSSHTLGASLNKLIGKDLSFSISTRQSQDLHGDSDNSIHLGLSLTLDKTASGRTQSLNATYTDQDNASRLSYRIGKKGKYGKDSLAGTLRVNSRAGDLSLAANARIQGETYDGSASLEASHNGDQTNYRSHLNLNTAFVFAEGSIARSSPVNDSFAIFEAPNGLKYPMAVKHGKSLFQRNTNDLNYLPKRYDVTIRPSSQGVLSGLNSYQIQHLSTDSAVLPDGLDLNETEFDVLPDYKSGYYFRVGGERGLALRLILRDVQSNPLVLEGGELIPDIVTANPIKFFTDKNGAMQLTNILAGRYRLELFMRPNMQKRFIQVSGQPGETQTLELVIF